MFWCVVSLYIFTSCAVRYLDERVKIETTNKNIKAETLRQIAATHRGDMSLRRCDRSPRVHCCCDKASCAYFVTAICRTNSNQFEFVRQIAATKFCRSDNDFHMSHQAICCSNLSRRRVAAICTVAYCVSALKRYYTPKHLITDLLSNCCGR